MWLVAFDLLDISQLGEARRVGCTDADLLDSISTARKELAKYGQSDACGWFLSDGRSSCVATVTPPLSNGMTGKADVDVGD